MLWISLAIVFSQLSLMAFGGGNTILPEMQRQVVHVHHWLSAREFSTLFAMAQAAPGPNMMIVPLIGWQIAGMKGLVVTALAKFFPSSCLTLISMHIWNRFKDAPWRNKIQRALSPVTVGLVFSSAILISQTSSTDWRLIVIMIITALMSFIKRIHPLCFLFGGALIGLFIL